MTPTEAFADLRSKLEATQRRMASAEGQKQEKQKALDTILKKYGVTSVEDLKKMLSAKLVEKEALEKEVTQYLKDSSEVLAKLDTALLGSTNPVIGGANEQA